MFPSFHKQPVSGKDDSVQLEKQKTHPTVTQTASSDADSQHMGRDHPQPPPVPEGWRRLSIQFCLCFGLLLSVMDTSIVSTSLITIATDFDDFIRVTWVVLGYMLTYMGFAIATAKLSDVVGRKWATVTSLVIFAGFSLGCGLAQTMMQLIAFRALQGVGGSGLFSLCMTTMPDITPRERISAMSAAIGVVFALSAVLGPVLGGVITTNGTWRWVFLLNVPCGCVILVLLLFSWRGSGQTLAVPVKWKQVDYIGAFLLMAASVMLVFALQEGGATAFAWDSPTIISTLVASGFCFLAFGAWIHVLSERQGSVDPIFPSRLVTQRVMGVVIASTILTGFSFILLLIQLPERFQIVNGNSPQTAGLHLLPLLIASATGSFLGGFISSKRNFTFYTLVVANSLILVGCGLLSTIPDGAEIAKSQYGYQAIYGLGVGLTFSTVTVMTIVNTSSADTAVAQGAVAQARVFGGCIGLAIGTILFNNRVGSDLDGILTPVQIDNLRQSLSTVLSLTPTQQLAVRDVFASSFNDQLRVCTYIAAGCFVISLFSFQKNPPSVLDKKNEQAEEMAKQQQKNECQV